MRRLGPALVALWLVGCRRSGLEDASQVAGEQLAAAGQSRCSVVKDPDKPLIVEWSGTDAAELEARLLRGVVAVRYEDCEMEVLPACVPPGGYVYAQTTTARQRISIGSLDDLLINIPLGLGELGGRVERGETLELDLVVVGRYEAPQLGYTAGALVGGAECSRATHVVTGVALGAFRLSARRSADRAGGLQGAGKVGGAARDEIEVVKESPPGALDSCAEVALADDPRRNVCTAPIRLEVTPIVAHAGAAGGREFLVPPAPAPAGASRGDVGLAAHQAHDAAVRAQEDPGAPPERRVEAWCRLAAIEEPNPYRAQAEELCARWRDHASALRTAEARMVRDYEDLRLLLELRSVTIGVQERAVAGFLDAHAGLSADKYPRVRAAQRAKQKLGRGQRTRLPNFGSTAADAAAPPEAAPRPVIDRRTYRKAISVSVMPRWIPTGYAIGGRVLGRVAFVHEVGFEVGYTQFGGFGGPWRHVHALAAYERVFRPDRVVRPHLGAAVGALVPVGPRPPCGPEHPCPSLAGLLVLGGGARVSLAPWFSLVAHGFVGAMMATPFVFGGIGGGIEFTIPTGRDWPE
jgi:hypothetical protein